MPEDTPTLDKLPAELLSQIAQYMHPNNVRNLSLLNQIMHLKAMSFMHTLSFCHDNLSLLADSEAPIDWNSPHLAIEYLCVRIAAGGFTMAVADVADERKEKVLCAAFTRLMAIGSDRTLCMRMDGQAVWRQEVGEADDEHSGVIDTLPPVLKGRMRWEVQGVDALVWATNSNAVALAQLLVESKLVPVNGSRQESSMPSETEEIQGEHVTSPIALAASLGFNEIVSLLLRHGADPTVADAEQRFCALNLAVQSGRLDTVNILLSSPLTQVDQRDYGQWTPLHWAAENDDKKLVSLLLSHGADVDALDEQHRSPLHWAISRGRKKMVELLLSKGANEHAVTISRTTSLHLAAANGHVDLVRLLISKHLERRADPGRGESEMSTEDFVNARDGTNRIPLHSGADDGHYECCKVLIQTGSNVSATDDDGFTPLHTAILNRQSDIATLLIASGAPLNGATINGNTPLHLAAAENDARTAQFLCSFALKQQLDSKTPLHLLAIRNAANHTALHHACCLGSVEATQTILSFTPPDVVCCISEAAQADLLDANQNTPLHLAIRFGHQKLIQAFVQVLGAVAVGDLLQAGAQKLLGACLDFTIECFLSLRPYNSSVDRVIARCLVDAGARASPLWDVGCVGCGKSQIQDSFFKCMICETIFCGGCRDSMKVEGGLVHDPTHGFVVGDKRQIVEFLLTEWKTVE